jgi:hypothetical protein
MRRVAAAFGRPMMSLFHVHHHDPHGVAEKSRLSFARVLARLAAAFKIVHRAIVVAKLRRLRNELRCHGGDVDGRPLDQDVAKFPQQPLILGDKWDF